MAASSCDASVSGRTPSLPRIGAAVPSFCAISAWSRCSGSIGWWPRSLASDCAACSASCALTVSLSSLIAILYLPSEPLRRAPGLDGRRIVARRLILCAVGAPAPGSGARRSANRCAPSHPMCRRSPCAALRGSAVRAAAALTGDAHLLTGADTGGDSDVDVAPRALPARTVARRARLPADVAAALACCTRLVHLERERLAGAVKRLVQRDLDPCLNVFAASPAGAPAHPTAEEIFEAAAPESHAAARCLAGAAHAGAEITEDRAEEFRKVSGVAVLHREATGLLTRGLLRVALPVGTEGVVSPSLLGIRQNLVRFVDLFEARVLTFVDVRVVLPGELPVGGLDRLVVGLPIDAQDPIVILEFDGHQLNPTRSLAGQLSLRHSKQPKWKGGPNGRPPFWTSACRPGRDHPR